MTAPFVSSSISETLIFRIPQKWEGGITARKGIFITHPSFSDTLHCNNTAFYFDSPNSSYPTDLPIHQSPWVKRSLFVSGSVSEILVISVPVGHYTGPHLLRHSEEHCRPSANREGLVLWTSLLRTFINEALCGRAFCRS